jgi:predicted DCC family thiol-disulfide oxidoreductase YuxK
MRTHGSDAQHGQASAVAAAPGALDQTAHAVVLFDGVCNVCNDAVKFILARDTAGYFRFASLQSDVAKQLLAPFGLAEMPLETMALIEGGRVYLRSSAVLGVGRRLGGGWRIVSLLGRLVPRRVRDALYAFLVRHRYRWFGQSEQCLVPTPAVRERFLDRAPRTPAPTATL